jgi:TonB family protein
MKRLSAFLVLLLVCVWSQTTRAQAADSWVSVPLEGDELTVLMPKSYKSMKIRDFTFERFKLDGLVYTATEDGVDYTVLSLVDKGEPKEAQEAYVGPLDYCADLVWESFLKPRRDQLSEEAQRDSRMSYVDNLHWTNTWYLPAGREYKIRLANRPGKTQFYVAGRRLYILIVLDEDANSIAAERFVTSFRVKKDVDPKHIPLGNGGGIGPGIGSGIGPGVGPGRGGNVGGAAPPATEANGATDYNKVFSGKDVTQKVRILSKPEPTYTESARKYAVTGTVVIRAVFASSGVVTQLRVFSGLPHGLTAQAVSAAKAIKFTPAQKDGHDVSMWFQLEYNFNLY